MYITPFSARVIQRRAAGLIGLEPEAPDLLTPSQYVFFLGVDNQISTQLGPLMVTPRKLFYHPPRNPLKKASYTPHTMQLCLPMFKV